MFRQAAFIDSFCRYWINFWQKGGDAYAKN